MSARSIALRLLGDMERKGQYSNLALDHALQNEPLSPKDKALLTTLFYGVIEKQITLDYYIRALSQLPRIYAVICSRKHLGYCRLQCPVFLEYSVRSANVLGESIFHVFGPILPGIESTLLS